MAAEYYLDIKTPAGVRVAMLTDMRYTAYNASVNAPGALQFAIRGNHNAVELLEMDSQVEVWRKDKDGGIDWYCDFYGLYRGAEWRSPTVEETTFTAYCVGQMDFLRRSVVAYDAGLANRTKFTAVPAETILKTLVTRNATASGTTADGRWRNVDAWGSYISVEADGAGGNSLTRQVQGRNLLDALQEIAAVGVLDFQLVKTGAQSWEFRTDTTLGDDRTGSMVFAMERNNIQNPVLLRNRMNEATVAVVAGAGEEAAQTFRIRTGTNYHAATNSRELWVAQSQSLTDADLDDSGDYALYLAEARDQLLFDVLQTPGSRYGRDYFLGDLVTAYYQGVSATKQITGVNIVYQDNGGDTVETIKVLMENWP